jgi:hypothetical protein
MEVEAGMNMENLAIIGKASWKMLSYFWPVVVLFIVGMIWCDKKEKQMTEMK